MSLVPLIPKIIPEHIESGDCSVWFVIILIIVIGIGVVVSLRGEDK